LKRYKAEQKFTKTRKNRSVRWKGIPGVGKIKGENPPGKIAKAAGKKSALPAKTAGDPGKI